MKLGFACTLTFALTANSAMAEYALTSASGHEYTLTCNESGYVLTSVYPVSRFVGQGAATRTVKGTEVIYMGRSCDAFSEVLGGGEWCWANGGVAVDLGGARLGFPRQELYCASNEDLGLDCLC